MVGLTLNKVGRVLLPQQIADQIQGQITGHQINPGDRLPAGRILSERFGVSRQCVREAYKILEERGLIGVFHGRGAFVLDYEPHHIQSQLSIAAVRGNVTVAHLFEVRRCLECSIAGLAAERSTPSDVARMEAAIEKMKDTVDHLEEFIVADQEFHTALAEATHNQLFSILIQPLNGLIQKYRKDVVLIPGATQNAINDHIEIVGCLKKKDIRRSQEFMERHLERFKQDAGLIS